MKTLLTFALLFSMNSLYSKTNFHEARFLTKSEVSSLHSSVDRVVPKFVEFEKMINGEDSDSLYLVNGCSKDIVAFVKYYSVEGAWVESDFWQLSENQYAYIGETQNEYYYPGALSTDGTLVWGDIPIVFKGYDVFVSEMRITSDDWGDWYHTYSCDSLK